MLDWIDTLAGRLFLLLVVGAVISALLALVVSDFEYRRRLVGVQSFAVAERVADFGAVMASPYVDDVEDEADDLSFALMDDRETLGPVDQPLTAAVQAALDRRSIPAVGLAREVSPYACGIDGDADDDDRRDRKGKGRGGGDAVQAEACRAVGLRIETPGAERTVWITAAIPARPAPLGIERVGLAFLGVLLLAAAILAFIAARMATAPLRRLSEAAGELGRDIDRPPLKEEGSREVREAAGAFNTMQARLKATMRDRTRMLAAITHDLQTPLTRLRLRIEKVDDPDLRARLIADLAATQGLIREGLDLARAEDTPEPLGPGRSGRDDRGAVRRCRRCGAAGAVRLGLRPDPARTAPGTQTLFGQSDRQRGQVWRPGRGVVRGGGRRRPDRCPRSRARHPDGPAGAGV